MMKEILETRGVSQAEACRRFGIPKSTMQSWVSGRTVPPKYVEKLLDFALAFPAMGKDVLAVVADYARHIGSD